MDKKSIKKKFLRVLLFMRIKTYQPIYFKSDFFLNVLIPIINPYFKENLYNQLFRNHQSNLLPMEKATNNFERIIKNNREWSKTKLSQDQNFFKKHADSQSPKYLFIGCSDSRIPAETILGLQPGEIFVHRNIANQVELSDINTLSVIQYAVEVLKVEDIIITGHYGCGGVKAAMSKQDFGPLQLWLSHIRSTRIHFSNKLNMSQQENFNLLCEINVKSQVYDMAKIPCVQNAWIKGQPLRIHGLIYRLDNGVLKDLGLTLDRIEQIPEEFWIHCPQKNKQKNKQASSNKSKPQLKSLGLSVLVSSIVGGLAWFKFQDKQIAAITAATGFALAHLVQK